MPRVRRIKERSCGFSLFYNFRKFDVAKKVWYNIYINKKYILLYYYLLYIYYIIIYYLYILYL